MSKDKDKARVAPSDTPGTPATTDDFAAMLAAYDTADALRLQMGDRVRGKVFHISKENVFVSLSASQEGVIPRTEVTDDKGRQLVALGDMVEAFVVSTASGVVLSMKLGKEHQGVEMLESARENGIPVEGVVTGVNKGGLEVTVGTTRGFCPIGQADINFVEDPQTFIGKTLLFAVKEVKERGRNIVLSRRALLEAERAKKVAELRASLAVGQRKQGVVTRTAAFGAFVDIGGLDGLIPMSELAHGRVAKVEDVINVGDPVEVEIRSVEDDPKKPGQLRISLSRRSALGDPWEEHGAAVQDGAVLPGKVARLENFGAFVSLFPGIDGLVHISEIAAQRIRHPQDVLTPGQEVTVRVLNADRSARRISLSIKQASGDYTPSAPSQRGAGGASGTPRMAPGAAVDGTVDRVESFGVFVKLSSGASALLPSSETGTPRGSDLAKAFPTGMVLALQVVGQDDRGRIRVSKVARERSEEQAEVAQYNRSQSQSGFGTLGDLLAKHKVRKK